MSSTADAWRLTLMQKGFREIANLTNSSEGMNRFLRSRTKWNFRIDRARTTVPNDPCVSLRAHVAKLVAQSFDFAGARLRAKSQAGSPLRLDLNLHAQLHDTFRG